MEAFQYELLAEVENRHWWHRVLRRSVADELERHGAGRRLRVLDAGCGTGGFSRDLAEQHDVTGIDLAAPALEHCRNTGLRRLVQAGADRLPLADSQFDGVVSIDVLSQLSVPHGDVALREMLRVLVPGGLLILQLSAFHWLAGEHDRTIRQRRYTRREVEGLVRGAGFEISSLRYRLGFMPPLMLLNNLVARVYRGARKPDLSLPSRPVNALFHGLASLELRLGWPAPWGSSFYCLGVRPE